MLYVSALNQPECLHTSTVYLLQNFPSSLQQPIASAEIREIINRNLIGI